MTQRTKLILTIIAGAVIIAVIALNLIFTAPPEKEPDPDTGGPVTSATLPPAGTDTPPTDPASEGGEQDPDPGTDHEHTDGAIGFEDGAGQGTIPDYSQVKQAAAAAVQAFSTVIEGETVEQRAARLSAFFDPSSPALTQTPRIANPWNNANVTLNSIQWTREPLTGVNGDDGNGDHRVTTVAPYVATYTVNNQVTEIVNNGDWNLTISRTTGKAITITEPSTLR